MDGMAELVRKTMKYHETILCIKSEYQTGGELLHWEYGRCFFQRGGTPSSPLTDFVFDRFGPGIYSAVALEEGGRFVSV